MNYTGYSSGNINAKGDKGGFSPKGNQNATTHGFFSKFLPAETINSMQERSQADLIYDQIEIQFAAIIRAQMAKLKLIKRPTRDEYELGEIGNTLVEAHDEILEVILDVWEDGPR